MKDEKIIMSKWFCCKHSRTTLFCSECGKPAPVENASLQSAYALSTFFKAEYNRHKSTANSLRVRAEKINKHEIFCDYVDDEDEAPMMFREQSCINSAETNDKTALKYKAQYETIDWLIKQTKNRLDD